MSVKCVEYTLNYIQTKTLRYIRKRCRRRNFNGNNTANNNNNLNNKHVNNFSKKMEKKHLFWWHLFPFYAYKKMILLLLLLFWLCVCVFLFSCVYFYVVCKEKCRLTATSVLRESQCSASKICICATFEWVSGE